MYQSVSSVILEIDDSQEGVTATTPKWFVFQCRDIPRAQLKGRPCRTTNHEGVVDVTPDRLWSIPIITWLNNFVSKVFMMKYIIRSKSPPNRATSPTYCYCDVTHPSLMTGVVALHIPSWRVRVCEERRQAHKTVWPGNAGRVICRYQNHSYGIINHHKHIWDCFLEV